MAEPQESAQLQDPKAEYTEADNIAGEIFAEFTADFPEFTGEQLQKARLFSLRLGQKISNDQKRIKELETKNDNLQKQSDRDPYNPDIYSAHGFFRIMKDTVANLKRNGQKAVVLAADLDNFKTYNDTQKDHIAGDNALGVAGGLMRDALRPSDIVARIHGDEYLIVLPDTDLNDGVIVAERVREAIPEMSMILDTPIQFSVSIGIVELKDSVIQAKYESDEPLIEAIKQTYQQADRAHYTGSKHAGKNRIGVMLPDGSIQTAIIYPNSKAQPPTVSYQEPVPVKV